MSTLALIALGSNLGDRKATLDAALAALATTPGVTLRASSRHHETAPVGGPGGQGPFLNAAAALETTLDPFALHGRLRQIEADAGRERRVRWGERTLDLDLLIHGTAFLQTDELTLPHPRMGFRRFVLAPLAEIAPGITHTPSGRSIAELLALLDRRPSYVALAGPPNPMKSAILELIGSKLSATRLRQEDLESHPLTPLKSWTDRAAGFEAAARRLDVDFWKGRDGHQWLISDFCLATDYGGSRHAVPLVLYLAAMPDRRAQAEASGESSEAAWSESTSRRERLRKLFGRVLTPTLGAVIDPAMTIGPAPWSADHPLLWPESDEPSRIADEILAACAATRA
jgi:2-amino-4-hydroxy-6-hydroxymethyldihydropteridine diphosphokinase